MFFGNLEQTIAMFNLEINLSTGTSRSYPAPPDQRHLGGRGLVAALVAERIPPTADPLGSDNTVILAPGLFAAAGIPTAQRLSIGSKSPLTGGIRESNAGGVTARALAAAKIKSVLISGRPQPGATYLIVIKNGQAQLLLAPELAGLGTYQTAHLLRQRFGPNLAALLIGPAGERLALAACALNLDYQGRPNRANGRGGLGAVLGSKGIKAIVVLPPQGTDLRTQPLVAPNLQPLVQEFCRLIKTSPNTQNYTLFGTALTGDLAQNIGCLPTRNFRRGTFVGKSQILGKTIRHLIRTRGGQGDPAHSCIPGCVIACSNIFPDRYGRELVAPLDYEAIASIGSNLCIDDPDAIARLYWLCNDLGIDVIEAGAALALLMDEGVIPWGSASAAENALRTAYTGDYPGDIISHGLVATANNRGVRRIAAVKGMAFAAFDPRAIKGLGVTYATSPQGADHTAGHTIRKKIDHHNKAKQVELSFQTQIQTALYDNLGICFFASGALTKGQEIVAQLFSTLTQNRYTPDDLTALGAEIIAQEIQFNRAAGLTPEDDRLPQFCYTEPLPPYNLTFDLSPAQLQQGISTYLPVSTDQ